MSARNTLAAVFCLAVFTPLVHAAPKTPSAQSQLTSLTQTIVLRRDAALAQLQSAKNAVAVADLKLSPVKPSAHFRLDALEKLLATNEETLAGLRASGKTDIHPDVAAEISLVEKLRIECDRLSDSVNVVVTDPAEIAIVKAQRDVAMQQIAVAQALVDALNGLIKQQSNLTASVKISR